MSLRPRYSLLTLLVVSALIAGGVKCWRGPHHVVIHDPPNEQEQLLLNQFLLRDFLSDNFPPMVNEYEYINSWNQPELLFVKGRFTSRQPIPIYRIRFSSQGRAYLFPDSELPSLAAENEPRTNEHLVCWMYNPKSKELASAKAQYAAAPRNPAAHGCYFLTNRKQLYRCNDLVNFGVPLDWVELKQIEDPEFRQCVAAELEKIPVAP